MGKAERISNNSESYSPSEKPEIITKAEKLACEKKFETYKDIEFRMDTLVLNESFKYAGVPSNGAEGFSNISKYHDEFRQLMTDRYAPYTEIGIWSNLTGSNADYVFGCQVGSTDNLPDGLVAVDTGLTRFAVITFRSPSAEELVGGEDGPGNGMKTAGEYIYSIWLPKHMDEVRMNPTDPKHAFEIIKGGKSYFAGMFEVYKTDIQEDSEMCFYIPLKS